MEHAPLSLRGRGAPREAGSFVATRPQNAGFVAKLNHDHEGEIEIMRFRTFLVTGVEVLQAGTQYSQGNAWPAKHWREHKGRWRLFTVAIDDYLTREFSGKFYGGSVEGIVIALEIADFSAWPEKTFVSDDCVLSYKTKHRDLWCFAKLNWTDIQHLTLKQQWVAYSEAVLQAINRIPLAKRKPKGFDAASFSMDISSSLLDAKVSKLTRSAAKLSTKQS